MYKIEKFMSLMIKICFKMCKMEVENNIKMRKIDVKNNIKM